MVGGAGNLSFVTSPIASSGSALSVSGKTGGTVSTDAGSPITASTTGVDALFLDGNTSLNATFAGRLELTASGAGKRAFVAQNGGQV